MTKCLIFDFDGTLADTSDGIIGTVQATLSRMGLPPVSDARIKDTIGLPLEKTILTGGNVPEERVQEGVDIYRSIFFEIANSRIKLFPGVRESIVEYRREGLKLAIATSRGSRSLGIILGNYGLLDCFDAFATSNGGFKPKPSPDMVVHLLGELGVSAAETLVIGDTTYDLEMGRGAGCRTCGVTYGNHDRKKLETANPDLTVDSLLELRFPY